ncbi:MAG: SGNH/GDSL hydrolase family protein [Burkholderiales bacterium]
MASCTRPAIHFLALLLLFLPGATHAGPLNLYVLGDSLLDSGNAYLITQNVYPLPPYAQRFSNGPVASEVLAANLGVTAIASELAGGTNYATGGATSGVANFAGIAYGGLALPPPFNGPPNQIALLSTSTTGGLTQQVGLLAGAPPPDIGSSLVLIWAGANDLFLTSALVANGSLPLAPETFIIAADSAAANVENAITALIAAGARNILAVNLPDLGMIPAGTDPANLLSPFWSAYTAEFNAQFLDAAYLAGLDPSVKLTEFDAFELFNDAIANPGKYGFTNVTDACLPTAGPLPIAAPCANPDEYLFWDSAHPTAAAHQLIGDLFYAAIPEPASLALIMAPLALLILRSRRQPDAVRRSSRTSSRGRG